MQEIDNLSDICREWIVQELLYIGWDDDTVQWAVFSGDCKFCEEDSELKQAIKEIWGIEFTSDSELDEYVIHHHNHIVTIFNGEYNSYLIY